MSAGTTATGLAGTTTVVAGLGVTTTGSGGACTVVQALSPRMAASRPLLAWAGDRSETKRPILSMSLGKPRVQPPAYRSRQEGPENAAVGLRSSGPDREAALVRSRLSRLCQKPSLFPRPRETLLVSQLTMSHEDDFLDKLRELDRAQTRSGVRCDFGCPGQQGRLQRPPFVRPRARGVDHADTRCRLPVNPQPASLAISQATR